MRIDISKPILSRNDEQAAKNRARLASSGVFALDVLASPGAGKTSTIVATIEALRGRLRIGVVEGDIEGRIDAERINGLSIPAVQINTGGACHLDAFMVSRALDALSLDELDLLIIENVGNLVCPAEFDLGQSSRIVILSVPEGHDKPVKYPAAFALADAVLLNKHDTLDYFDFDEQAFRDSLAKVNGSAPLYAISATRGDGIGDWAAWLDSQVASAGRIAESGY